MCDLVCLANAFELNLSLLSVVGIFVRMQLERLLPVFLPPRPPRMMFVWHVLGTQPASKPTRTKAGR
jgi:hypothetical protein